VEMIICLPNGTVVSTTAPGSGEQGTGCAGSSGLALPPLAVKP
jgi:hypothetical protein